MCYELDSDAGLAVAGWLLETGAFLKCVMSWIVMLSWQWQDGCLKVVHSSNVL